MCASHRGCEWFSFPVQARKALPWIRIIRINQQSCPGKSLKDYYISLQLSRLDVFRDINNDLAPLCPFGWPRNSSKWTKTKEADILTSNKANTDLYPPNPPSPHPLIAVNITNWPKTTSLLLQLSLCIRIWPRNQAAKGQSLNIKSIAKDSESNSFSANVWWWVNAGDFAWFRMLVGGGKWVVGGWCENRQHAKGVCTDKTMQ